MKGKVRTAIGGKELRKIIRKKAAFVELFTDLRDLGYLINIDDKKIDCGIIRLDAEIKRHFKTRPSCCDDDPLFFLGKASNSKYVVSGDKRIGKCRRVLNNSKVSGKFYSKLVVLRSDKSYLKVKEKGFG